MYGQKPEAQIGIPARLLTSRMTLDEHLAQAGFIIIRPPPPRLGGPNLISNILVASCSAGL